MHRQLADIVAELGSSTSYLHRLSDGFDDVAWSRRPSSDSWSASECIVHLNLTSDVYLRLIPPALEQARSLRVAPPKRFRRDFLGWLIWRMSRPQTRVKSKTTPPFIPPDVPSKAAVVSEFDRLQQDLINLVRSADGLPIDRIKVVSPFAEKVRYSTYSALTILATHQQRHLLQAERALV